MDRPNPAVVEIALKLQKGSVLAREVLALRHDLAEEEGAHESMRQTMTRQAAELEELRAALKEIRDMHQTVDDDPGGPPYCPHCDADGYPDPCETSRIARRALEEQ